MYNYFKMKILLSFLLLSSAALADLTPTQLSTLNADMQSNPAVSAMVSAEDDIGLGNYYSTDSPDKGWKSNLSTRELFDVLDWQEVISRSQAERDTLNFMFALGQVDAGQANVRKGLADIFSGGTPRTVAQRTALVNEAQRFITYVEKVLSTGVSGGIYTLGYEGGLSSRDAAFARTYQP